MNAYEAHAQKQAPVSRGLLSSAVEPIRREFQIFGFKGGVSNLVKRGVRLVPGGGIFSLAILGEPKSVEAARWKTMHAVEQWKEMRGNMSPREWAPPAVRTMPEEHSRVIQFSPEQAERFRQLAERKPLGQNPLLEEHLRKREAALSREPLEGQFGNRAAFERRERR